MSELWQGVLLGTLLSIPFSFAVNIISPYINRRIDKRSEASSEKRALEDAAFRADAGALAKDRPALYMYLLEALIRMAYIGALFGAFSGALFVVSQVIYFELIGAVAQAIALVGTIIVLNIARPAVQMIREVRAVNNPPAPSTSGTQTPVMKPADPAPALESGTEQSSTAGTPSSSDREAHQQPSAPPPAS